MVSRENIFLKILKVNGTFWMSAWWFLTICNCIFCILWRKSKTKFLLVPLKLLTNYENTSSNPLQLCSEAAILTMKTLTRISSRIFMHPMLVKHWRENRPKDREGSRYIGIIWCSFQKNVSRIRMCFQRSKQKKYLFFFFFNKAR